MGAAPGIAIGPAFVYQNSVAGRLSTPAGAGEALQQLAAAQRAAAQRFTLLAERQRRDGFASEAGIFDFLAQLAEDPDLTERIGALLTQGGLPLDDALRAAVEQVCEQLRQSENPLLRERAADLEAVEQELRRILLNGSVPVVPPGAIVVAAALTPADVRPAFTATIGFDRAMRRASRANRRGFPNDSR